MSFRNRWSSRTSSRIASRSWSRCHRHSSRPAERRHSAFGFSQVGTPFILLSPFLGWIAVALSGSNTASNAVFGQFQASVGKLLGEPALLFPSLNSVGAEVGKPVPPQTASVGVSTTTYVRSEGVVIRHNMPWTLVVLAYLIGIGCLYYFSCQARCADCRDVLVGGDARDHRRSRECRYPKLCPYHALLALLEGQLAT